MRKLHLRVRSLWSIGIATLVIVSACGGQTAAPAASAAPSASAGNPIAALYEAAKQEKTFVLYSSETNEQAQAYLTGFQKAYPGIQTQLFRVTSAELDARVIAEASANNVKSDVIMTSSMAGVMDWFNAKLLLQNCGGGYDYYDKIGLPKGWLESCYYFPYALNYWFPMVNTKTVPQADIARMVDWASIVQVASEKRYKIGAGDPELAGGMYNFYFIMRSNYGMPFFEKIAALGPVYDCCNAPLIAKLSSGELAVLTNSLESYYAEQVKAGAPIAALVPKDGLPSLPILAASMAAAPHPSAAKLFQQWLMTKQGQEVGRDSAGNSSVRADVPRMTSSSVPSVEGIPNLSLKVDWTKNLLFKKTWTDEWVAIAKKKK